MDLKIGGENTIRTIVKGHLDSLFLASLGSTDPFPCSIALFDFFASIFNPPKVQSRKFLKTYKPLKFYEEFLLGATQSLESVIRTQSELVLDFALKKAKLINQNGELTSVFLEPSDLRWSPSELYKLDLPLLSRILDLIPDHHTFLFADLAKCASDDKNFDKFTFSLAKDEFRAKNGIFV